MYSDMRSARHSKPRLIVLEGPAAVGKTTLQHLLWSELGADGITTKCIPEFSESVLGESLRDNSQFGDSKPDWMIGLGGTLAFLADKTKLLEDALRTPETVWICDRLITSQLVLGVKGITREREKELVMTMVRVLSGWIEASFAKDSIMILIEAPIAVLKNRLEARVGRPPTPDELRLLVEEIDSYAALKSFPDSWPCVRLNSNKPLKSILAETMGNIRSSWTL